MKKLILTLVVLALMAPAYVQAITFTATDADGVCTVEFDAGLDPNVPPVAMALTITVDGDDPCDKITAVDGIDSFFDIYMDAAYDMESDPCTPGYSYGAGGPIAKVAEAGQDVLPSASFCISMGGLGGDTKPLAEPSMSGTAFVLHAGNAVADPCGPSVTGTIAINALRGGVIGSDTEPMDTNLSIPFSITISGECMPQSATTADPVGLAENDSPEANGSTTYAEWVAAGKPNCWCYQAHCRGNSDGFADGSSKTGYYQVGATDLNTLMVGWQVMEPPVGVGAANVISVDGIPGICANFNRMKDGSSKTGYYHVGAMDLNRLMAGWQINDPGVPLNDCGGSATGPYPTVDF